MNSLQIIDWTKEFSRLCDLAQDWYLKSTLLGGIDRQIAKLYYQKSCDERREWVKKGLELWKNQN